MTRIASGAGVHDFDVHDPFASDHRRGRASDLRLTRVATVLQQNSRIATWHARHAEADPAPLPDPIPSLPAAVAGVAPGRALDLACGAGRHAVWLAARGWRVDAVDGAPAALDRLQGHAARAGCLARVAPHIADLEADPPAFTIAPSSYDLIVDCFFLHRPLFAAIRDGVRPGGLFVAAFPLPSAAAGRGHGYVLAPGELEGLVTGWGWTVLRYRERPGAAAGRGLGTAEIAARRPVAADRASAAGSRC